MSQNAIRPRRIKQIAVAALSVMLLPACQSVAMADEDQPLKPGEAVLDDSPPADLPHDFTTRRTLNGSVSRNDSIPGDPSMSGGLGAGLNQLKAVLNLMRQAQRSGMPGVYLNGQLMQPGVYSFGRRTPTMSPDEFRKLEHGIIGLDSTITFNSECPVVTYCYPTCPAAEAGIKPGDLLYKAGDHVFKHGDGQVETWRYIGGKAGTPVDITVLREGKEIVFHLVRMNIEDIKDDRIRLTYESLLSALGPPGQ